MKNLTFLNIEELQRLGRNGDEHTITELGKRFLDFDFCLLDDNNHYC